MAFDMCGATWAITFDMSKAIKSVKHLIWVEYFCNSTKALFLILHFSYHALVIFMIVMSVMLLWLPE